MLRSMLIVFGLAGAVLSFRVGGAGVPASAVFLGGAVLAAGAVKPRLPIVLRGCEILAAAGIAAAFVVWLNWVRRNPAGSEFDLGPTAAGYFVVLVLAEVGRQTAMAESATSRVVYDRLLKKTSTESRPSFEVAAGHPHADNDRSDEELPSSTDDMPPAVTDDSANFRTGSDS